MDIKKTEKLQNELSKALAGDEGMNTAETVLLALYGLANDIEFLGCATRDDLFCDANAINDAFPRLAERARVLARMMEDYAYSTPPAKKEAAKQEEGVMQ